MAKKVYRIKEVIGKKEELPCSRLDKGEKERCKEVQK